MWMINVIVQPLVINFTPNDLWETIFEKFDKIIGIWGLSLSANTWIEAVTLEKLVRKKSWGTERVERKCLLFPPFLPYFDKPQLLTFGRLQSRDFCSWERTGEEDQCSDLKLFHSYLVKMQREPSMNHSYMWSYTRDTFQASDWTASQRWQGSGTLVKLGQNIYLPPASPPESWVTWIRCNVSSIGNISCTEHRLEVTYTSRRQDLKSWYWYHCDWEPHLWPCGEMYSAALIKELGGRSFV